MPCDGRDPAQVLFATVTLGRKRLQDAIQVGRRAAQLCLEPRDGRRKPRRREWFHHVVDRALLEGRHRMLVVGGDEYHVAPAIGLLSDFEAVQAGHLDVEEHDVGRQPLDGMQGFDAIAGFGGDDQVRPQRRQCLLELGAQHRLVFSDDCGRRRVHREFRRRPTTWRCRRDRLSGWPPRHRVQPDVPGCPGASCCRRRRDGIGARYPSR